MKLLYSIESTPALLQENQDKILDEKIKDIRTDRWLRIGFAIIALCGVYYYGYHVIEILYKQGGFNMFVLSEGVLITLLTTTTANVLILLHIIAKYLFPKDK